MRLRFRRPAPPPDLSLDEVYRLYGLTMEHAQLLEQIIRGHARRHEFVNLRETGSSPPLLPRIERIDGKTIGWVEKRYPLPDDTAELVKLARELRNNLAHNFLEGIDKHTTEGRIKAPESCTPTPASSMPPRRRSHRPHQTQTPSRRISPPKRGLALSEQRVEFRLREARTPSASYGGCICRMLACVVSFRTAARAFWPEPLPQPERDERGPRTQGHDR
jgi:hypothetical protein